MRSAGLTPNGYICNTRYEHAGECWDYSCVKQSLPVTCARILKLPALAVRYQAYYT